MKWRILILLGLLLLAACPRIAEGQSSSNFWILLGTRLKPIVNTWMVNMPGGGSGSTLKAQKSLASSGTLVWEGNGSGAVLTVSGMFDGAGLSSCSNATTSKLLWNSTTKRFSCGTDIDTSTSYTAGQGLALNGTVFRTNSILTGSLVSFTTVSGSIIKANTSLASSGTLVWEGQGSGARLYVGDDFEGAGLTDCDDATSTLSWDSTAKRFGCGTDSDTTYNAGQGLTLNGTVFRTNSTLSGSLARFTTLSGSVVYAKTSVSSSGSLTWEGAASGATLYLGGRLEGAGLTDCDLSTQTLNWDATTGRFSCGTDLAGMSTGSFLTMADERYVNVLGDTMTGKLTINLTSGWDALEILQHTSGAFLHAHKGLSASGVLVVEPQAKFGSGAAAFLPQEFQSGAYIFGSGAGLLVLDSYTKGITHQSPHVLFGYQGTFDTNLYRPYANALRTDGTLTAGTTLTSSGNLVWETSASGATLYVATSVNGSGLTDCDLAAQTLNWDATTGRFSCGTDSDTQWSNTGSLMAAFDQRYVNVSGDTMTGALNILVTGGTDTTISYEATGTTSGTILHANKLLTSSGTLLVESGAHIDGNTFYVDATGNRVGIGTSAPAATLDIVRSGTANIRVLDTLNGVSAALQVDSDGAFYYTSSNHKLFFGILSAAKMTIDLDGDVGIATTTPKVKLSVVGPMSGSTLTTYGVPSAGIGKAKCYKAGGVEGYCSTAVGADGSCTCN